MKYLYLGLLFLTSCTTETYISDVSVWGEFDDTLENKNSCIEFFDVESDEIESQNNTK